MRWLIRLVTWWLKGRRVGNEGCWCKRKLFGYVVSLSSHVQWWIVDISFSSNICLSLFAALYFNPSYLMLISWSSLLVLTFTFSLLLCRWGFHQSLLGMVQREELHLLIHGGFRRHSYTRWSNFDYNKAICLFS